MTDRYWWPDSYFSGRERFRDQARTAGAWLASLPITAGGDAGQALTIDLAGFTTANDEHRVILISGVHGVEGFVGTAAQIQAMQNLQQSTLPARTGLLLVHAVNPWGYAHLRRVNEDNVDLNRNFISETDSLPASHPDYARLDPLINPPVAPAPGGEPMYWARALRLIIGSGGIAPLVKPIAQGQYNFPQGIFFGGTRPSESSRLLQQLIREHTADVERVTVLDVHTGLGPSATATLIGNSNVIVPGKLPAWLSAQYGCPAIQDAAEDNAYNATGTLGRWCQSTLDRAQLMYLCVEIGTVNPVRLFSALLRENQSYHWSARDSAIAVRCRQRLQAVFSPESRHWRSTSVSRILHILDHTLQLQPVSRYTVAKK